ncbi:hypothetical protein JHK82_034136 [Glycine max]|uniref:WEB family protein n=2 Tax=Glycine subgen. Soja TaxID=1462606 RepID=I1LTD2_SOYBN|nr:WEB family protein At3g51220 [Glycine max]KAG5119716.1 hypothetical protein JHK82_034136 [Glycine max]KRH26326.1 hypothetical protein GLYMA_12G167600v4 [Glycine max]|eukprot:XP_003539392.2 WEB family protein At3g51220 [Glycine max]
MILKYYLHPPSPKFFSSIPTMDFSSTVDTSRPFTSVKEAVAIFGERLLLGEIYSPIKRESSWRLSSPSPSPSSRPMKTDEENNNNNNGQLADIIKKLEAELEQTKVELKLLKERGSETEVALATLNAELHKNMSKLAQAEATAAGKAATTKTVRFEISEDRKDGTVEKKKESQSLSHMLSLGEKDHLFGGKKGKKQKQKQKPIIPLVGDLFFKRKSSSTTSHHNPLYASPF